MPQQIPKEMTKPTTSPQTSGGTSTTTTATAGSTGSAPAQQKSATTDGESPSPNVEVCGGPQQAAKAQSQQQQQLTSSSSSGGLVQLQSSPTHQFTVHHQQYPPVSPPRPVSAAPPPPTPSPNVVVGGREIATTNLGSILGSAGGEGSTGQHLTPRTNPPPQPTPPPNLLNSGTVTDQQIRVLTPSEIMRTLPSLGQETYDIPTTTPMVSQPTLLNAHLCHILVLVMTLFLLPDGEDFIFSNTLHNYTGDQRKWFSVYLFMLSTF